MIYLIRHGQTAWTISKQHTGRTDLPLTQEGEAQALKLRTKLSLLEISHVFSSPLKRASLTCSLAGYGEEMLQDSLLMEWNYGSYEGLTSETIREQRKEWNIFKDGAPGGESPDQIRSRADRFLEKLPQGNVAIFSHGHFLRALTARYLKLSVDYGRLFQLSPASFSILGLEHGKEVIHLWNDTSHL